jgi:hypothetical protein
MMMAPDRPAMAIMVAIAVPAAIFMMFVVGDDDLAAHMVAIAHSVMIYGRVVLNDGVVTHRAILRRRDLMMDRMFDHRLRECGHRKTTHGYRERGGGDHMTDFHCSFSCRPC